MIGKVRDLASALAQPPPPLDCDAPGLPLAEVVPPAAPPVDLLAELRVGHHLEALGDSIDAGVRRIATGWPRLDAALGGGFAFPSLNILGAAPKSGKSTWAQHVARHHLAEGGAVLYVDLENGRRRYLRQLLCRKAELGGAAVEAAMNAERSGVFSDRAAASRWQAAKAWVRDDLPLLFVSFKPLADWEATIRAVRAAAGEAPLLVVVDSLQKLPGDLAERRAVVDAWIRLFEALRHDLDVIFLVVSEIKRSQGGAYVASESAFKESGGIEYAADLAMTMTRPTADEDEAPVSTLTVQLCRDSDEEPRGDVASYAPVRPHYGLQELEPAPRREKRRSGPRAEARGTAEAFLRERLAAGPVLVSEVRREAAELDLSESSVDRAKRKLGVELCLLQLKNAWRLP